MKLYHYQIRIPYNLDMPKGAIELKYGYHAKEAANTDRYGAIRLPAVLDTSRAKVIEVETDDNDKVNKVLYRVNLDREKDLCIVMMPNGFVKTVWINLKKDNHKTLQRWKYES